MVPEAAEAELRAQVERAFEAGMKPAHVDAHVAVAMLPELLGAHIALGREYGLFPVLPRSTSWAPSRRDIGGRSKEFDPLGMPVVDHCRGTLLVDSNSSQDRFLSPRFIPRLARRINAGHSSASG